MENKPYSVYALVDDSGRINAVDSDAFLNDLTGWTKSDEGYGDKYHHAQGNYFPGPVLDDYGVPLYKLEDGAIVERSSEELEADRPTEPEPEPDTPTSESERVTALEKILASYEAAYAEGVNEA